MWAAVRNWSKKTATAGTAASWRSPFRWFGVSVEGQDFKAALRGLYKAIHPDLFHSHPREKTANERSFKLLQEYLAEARGGSRGGVARQYRFEFFLRPATQGLENDAVAAGDVRPADDAPGDCERENAGVAERLHRVEVTLPPPGWHRSRSGSGPPQAVLAPSTHRALGLLFLRLGLQHLYPASAGQEASHLLSLFLPEAAHSQRQLQLAHGGEQRELDLVQAALRLGRQLHVEFAAELAQAAPKQKLAALKALSWALDQAPSVDLAKCRLVLGDGQGVDGQGRLWIDTRSPAGAWVKMLLALDVQQMRVRAEAVRRLRQQEATVSRAAGLAAVYSDSSTTLSGSYRQLLQSLECWAADHGPAGGGRLRSVRLHAVHAEEGGDGAAASVDAAAGIVTVPLPAEAGCVYAFLQEHGRLAQEGAEKEQHLQTELARTLGDTRRRLRLRHLHRDPLLPRPRALAAARRLLERADHLCYVLDGLSVRLSDQNRLPSADRLDIDLAWDFDW